MPKSNIIDPSKKHNHRWKVDPRYEEGFDYGDPKCADVPDELKCVLHPSFKIL